MAQAYLRRLARAYRTDCPRVALASLVAPLLLLRGLLSCVSRVPCFSAAARSGGVARRHSSLSMLKACLSRALRLSSAERRPEHCVAAALLFSARAGLHSSGAAADGGAAKSAAAGERCVSPPQHGSDVVCQWGRLREFRARAARAQPRRATLRLRASAFRSISVTFIDRDGEHITCRAPIGQNLLEVAHANNVDLEARSRRSLSRVALFSAHASRCAGRVRGVAGMQHMSRHSRRSGVLCAPEGAWRRVFAGATMLRWLQARALTASALRRSCGRAGAERRRERHA